MSDSETVEMLAAIWQAELGLSDPPTADEQLGDLGANSVVMIGIAAEVEQRTGVQLPLPTYLDVKTVRELARRIDECHGAAAGGSSA